MTFCHLWQLVAIREIPGDGIKKMPLTFNKSEKRNPGNYKFADL